MSKDHAAVQRESIPAADAADAAAIREAVMRPHMRFVPVKTFNRLAGYAYVNGAERLRHDAAMLDVWFHTLGARIS
jgi:transposase